MAERCEGEETVNFRRRKELRGVEIRTVENTSRTWHCYSTDYEFLAPITWRGEIKARNGTSLVEPGSVFSTYPDEVFAARRVLRAGAGRAVTIEPSVLEAALEEHGVAPCELVLPQSVTMSARFQAGLFALFDVIAPESTPLELESTFVEFVAVMVHELAGRSSSRAAAQPGGSVQRVSKYVHERLMQDTMAEVDLATLAQETKLSRFQTLRAFKRSYGLPPHNYRLRVRLALAKRSLRDGVAPAQVAADYGFVDQSHLTRHFKRLTGVTPMQYARIDTGA